LTHLSRLTGFAADFVSYLLLSLIALLAITILVVDHIEYGRLTQRKN